MARGNGVRALVALVTATAALLAAATASGQIVYAHGGDLYVMNDSGGGQRLLLSAAQVGGQIGELSGGDNGVSVQPNGTGIAFAAAVPAAGTLTCNGESHCPGLYSLVGGKVRRLTQVAANCQTAINDCGGEDTDPAVTTSGNVVFYNFFVDSTFTGCGIYYCGYGGGLLEQYYTTPLDGSQAPTAWPTPPKQGTNYPNGAEPGFEGPIASDPADPTKIAYGGNYLTGVDLLNNKGCGPSGDSNCYPLDVESSNGTYTETSLDDSFYYGLSFSPDGSRIADIETGDHKGIWIYPSNQSWGTLGTPNPSATYTWAVKDPDEVPGAQEFDHVISGLTWTGSGLVVSANYNLYLIPNSCLSPPSSATNPTANCTLANATQLTHDGTSAAPDNQPAWTASSATIDAYSTTPPPCTTCTPSGNQISNLKLASKAVKTGKPVVIDVTLKSAVKITVEVLVYVPASGHGKHRKKAHYKRLGTLTGTGKAGPNGFSFTKVGGHKLKPGKYELLVSAGGKALTLKFTVRK